MVVPARTSFPVAKYIKFSTSDSNLEVGDLVALDRSNDNSVIRCDASDENKMPAIGIAKSVGATSAIIQVDHSYRVPYTVTLTRGESVYADPDSAGKITNLVPVSGNLQKIGNAQNSNTILLSFDNLIITL